MDFFVSILIVVHVLIAIAICVFVLLQHGKGADLGAAFGSGASGSVFGSAGTANFLSRTTTILVALFFFSSMGLTYYSTKRASLPADGSVMDRVVVPQQTAPVTPTDVPQLPTTPVETTETPADVPAPATDAAPAESAPAVETTADPAANAEQKSEEPAPTNP
jgi:protein translocase, SecG subunit